jgi:hypothetical protein
MITIWTRPGSSRHCEMCDAFLDSAGYVIVGDALHQVVTMETPTTLPAHLARTCWRLVEAVSVGAA